MRSALAVAGFILPVTRVLGQLKEWSTSDCVGPAITPQNYDLTNVAQTMLTEEFLSNLQNSCATDGGGSFKDSGSCNRSIKQAEEVIYTLFATSDADLVYIYQGMYGCSNPKGPVLYDTIMSNYKTLLDMNQTVFGTSGNTSTNPGLMRNLMTLMDGIQSIEAVASGQMASLQEAVSNQKQATLGVKSQLLATAANLKEDTLSFMKMLVANRTMVQKAGFADVGKSVEEAIDDIQNQASEITSSSSEAFEELKKQYNQWTTDTNTAMNDVVNKSQTLKSQTNILAQLAKSAVADLQSDQTGAVTQAFKDTVNGFNSDLVSAQHQVAGSVSQLGDDLSGMIAQSSAGFSADVQSLSSDLNQNLASTSTAVENDPQLLSNTAADTTQKAQVSMSNLASLVQSTVLPLIANVQAAMQSVVSLQAAIQAAQSQMDSDVDSIAGPATQDSNDIGRQVSTTFAGYQSNFDAQFETIRSQMLSQIKDKVVAGRNSLQQILNSVTSTQGGAVSQQQMEGKVSQNQASASMSAANLINAQAQNAADNTQAGLDSMVGVVGGALSDAQDTLQEVGAANVGQISSLTGRLQAGQHAATQQAYAQLNSANTESSKMANQAQSDSNSVQLAGINLQNSLQQAGTSLQGSVSYQNSQAQQLLSDVNGILQVAQQYGGSLSDQMTNFEKQMPALYQVLMSKIAAYQSLLSSQGAQAQTSATGAVAADASDSLANLVSDLQNITSNTTGATTSLKAQQAAAALDAASVIADIQSLNGQIAQQGVTGAGMVSAAAQQAAAQTNAQVQSASRDSAAAVTALMKYNSDLVKFTQSHVLDSGSDAVNAALNAAQYLTDNAQNYVNLSNQFVVDAQRVENAGQVNLSSMVSALNSTLTTVANNAQMYTDQMNQLGSQLSGWPGQASLEASNVNAAIQAKIAQITNALVSMDAINATSAANTQQIAKELQKYIDELKTVYKQQRDSFNKFAQQYAMRRIALLTGLNSTILAQKAAFLQSLASSDLDGSGRAAQTTSVLQGLANAIQAASQQGGMDMNRVAAMVSNIGSGVSSLTQSLANQMTTQVSSLKQQAIMNGMKAGDSMGSVVKGAGSQAHLLGNQFASALKQIGGSDMAMQLAADGSSRDAYSIAGLLNSTSQATRMQIASLLREVEAGNLTMQAVIDTAKNMSDAQVSTVEDVINAFGAHIATHMSNVDTFDSSIESSASALNTTASHAVLPHTGLQADVIADIAAQTGTIHALRGKLLPTGSGANSSVGQIQAIQDNRGNSLQTLESNITNLLYGSNVASNSTLSASITGLTSSSFIENRATPPISSPSKSVQLTLPDLLSKLNVALSKVTNVATQAQANASALISSEIKNANSQIQEILSITASALGVQM